MLHHAGIRLGNALRGWGAASLILIANATCHFAGAQTPPAPSVAAAPGDGAADRALRAMVDQAFSPWDKLDSPGFVVGVVREGKRIHHRGYGMANLDDGVPLSIQSVLHSWSMSKTFTTLCVAMLLDQGKIDLDDPVSKFVPEIPAYDSPIHIRHLLQCTTGLHDYYLTMQLAGWSWRDAWTGHDVLDLLCRRKSLDVEPGTKFLYSNSDYFLLALIVERASGQSMRDFAQENVFGPLNMKGTFYDDEPAAVVKNRAVGYERRPDGRFYRAMIQSNTVGPIGLWTTVEDLFLWDQNFYENRLKEGRYLKAFLKRGQLDNRKALEAYAAETYRGQPRSWYTGGGPGYFAQMLRFPAQKFSVILLSNIADEKEWLEMTRIIQEIADRSLADHLAPRPETEPKWDANARVVQVADADLLDKAGLYRAKGGLFNRLVVKDGKLLWINPYQRVYPLQPLDATRFRSLQSAMPCDLEFVKSEPEGRFAVNVVRKDGGGGQWKAVASASPAPKQLSHYTGEYFCDELNATYVFSIDGGSLCLQINNGSKRRMTPMIEDVFIPADRLQADWIFSFGRSAQGAISGLTIDVARVSGVRFQKAPQATILERPSTRDP